MTKYTLLLCLAFLLCNCNRNAESPVATAFQPEKLLHAKNFSIERNGDYSLIRIQKAWKNAAQDFSYLLYPRGQTPPNAKDFPNTTFIPVPLERVLCTGTTQAAMLDFIGVLDKIVAIADDKYIYNKTIQDRIQQGLISPIGNDGQWDYERGLAAAPQAVFAFSIGDNQQTIEKWASLGVPVIMLSEFMEETPLGRAEWSRFMACFFDKKVQDRCRSRFDSVASHYSQLQQVAKAKTQHPSVFTGTAFEGSWYVAGGKSFVAQLIQDAGGDYLWSDNSETGGVPLDFEAVYAKARTADFWLNVLQTKNKTELLTQNARYADFAAFRNNRIYSYTKRISANGGYDFFESAIVQPQLVLQDLMRIFYPEQDTALYYYQAVGDL